MLALVRPGPARVALAALLLGSASACLRLPQRVPGPLVLPGEESAPLHEGGAESSAQAFTALVQRDSDPVWVGRPSERGDYPLPFQRKHERISVGYTVRTGAGGRAEILWAPDATSIVLFDDGRLTLGDTARDEPLVHLHTITHALLVLTPEDRVELPGGSLLRGDPAETTGPVLLERVSEEYLRLTNQSKRGLLLSYRDLGLELMPGESIDLPQPPFGCAPLASGPEPSRLVAGGVPLALTGRAERSEEPGSVWLRAAEPVEIEALGVHVRLAGGEEARLSGLAPVERPSSSEPAAPQ